MEEIALAKINSFAPVAQQAEASPEVPIFVLTSSQLQGLIKEAIQDLTDEISDLKATVVRQDEKIAALESLEAHDISDIYTAIDEIDRKIVRTPTAPPRGEKTKARIMKIDEILKARGSTTLKELERIIKIRPQEMSRIVARLDKRRYEIFLRDGDEREKVLRLKAQIV